MMRELQSLTLGICVLCTMAGLIRLLCPPGGFKAVINGALVLYILATGMKMARGADWPAFARELYKWRSGESIAVTDYTDYANEVADDATAAAIDKALRDNGIKAQISVNGSECAVLLHTAQDLPAARALLQGQSDTLQFRFEVYEDDG